MVASFFIVFITMEGCCLLNFPNKFVSLQFVGNN